MTSVAKDVLVGTSQSEKYTTNVANVAKNVSRYIKNDGAGHRMYGIGYLVSQVHIEIYVRCPTESQLGVG